VRGLEIGYFQREIALAAERQQRAVESGDHVVVGVNAFTEGGDDSDIDILKIGDEPEKRQRERLAELRARRDGALVQERLGRLRQAAADGTNVIEPMLDCVRAYATLYEIRHALEEVYGAYREPIFF
jgi:methylmalonyl-CoA mutase N-terminal domain/subunit